MLIGNISCAGSKKPPLKETLTPVYKEASLDQLISLVNTQARSIHSMKASLYIDFKKATSEKSQSVQNKLALARPDKVLLVSFKQLLPTLFTMVSDGDQFWLHIPSKKEVFVGKNHPYLSNSHMESSVYSLRPRHLVDALLLEKIDFGKTSQIVYTEVLPDTYILDVGVRNEEDTRYYPQRRIFIEREDLRISHYQYFSEKGLLMSDVAYGDYKKVGDLEFPYRVDIKRPWEGIEMTLTFSEVEINTTLNPSIFTFSLPKGHKVVELEN
jgi:outer membrane lipoprotein-sorting protein